MSKNVVTAEFAAMFNAGERHFADRLVEKLREEDRQNGEPAPDGWTVIEIDTEGDDLLP